VGNEPEQEVPWRQRRFMLTPVDLVLTMDLLLLAMTAGVVLNQILLEGELLRPTLVGVGLPVLGFAGWLGRRHKVPPPPPSDNPLRRGLGLLLLGVGGTVTLVGFAAAVIGVAAFVSDKKNEVPWFAVPLSFLPLLLGHALMFGGATARAGRARTVPSP
jgi:hypothetical protein